MTTTPPTQTVVHDEPKRSRARAAGAPPRAIITRDGERALRAELGRVRRRLEGDMAHRLREARGFGAPADNDEYLQIQEEEIILAVRAARLEELLERAQVIDGGTLDGRAAVGTIVEVKDTKSDEVIERELVGARGRDSRSSPFGRPDERSSKQGP